MAAISASMRGRIFRAYHRTFPQIVVASPPETLAVALTISPDRKRENTLLHSDRLNEYVIIRSQDGSRWSGNKSEHGGFVEHHRVL